MPSTTKPTTARMNAQKLFPLQRMRYPLEKDDKDNKTMEIGRTIVLPDTICKGFVSS